jgi:hypothetical protein
MITSRSNTFRDLLDLLPALARQQYMKISCCRIPPALSLRDDAMKLAELAMKPLQVIG